MSTACELPVVEARQLVKSYRLGELVDVRQALRNLVGRARGRPPVDRHRFYALSEVSFEIEEGECLGILGSNGSGKSTLVQILAGIIVPTAGDVAIRGRVLPLLEVGAGFHQELTGRENVMLFGTILGLDPAEIRSAMPAIAEFGEIDEAHMDTPLKRYSMGMRARLSFAVAMRFPAELYIFDEVMAVVDDHFRAVAVREIEDLVAAGKTVIFISHDLELVRRVCHRGMWLDKGRLRAAGPIDEVADVYAAFQREGLGAAPDPKGSG